MLEDDEIVAMDDFHAFQFPGADFIGVESADTPRKLCALLVANTHDVVLGKLSDTLRNAGRQQTSALVSKCVAGTVVHP